MRIHPIEVAINEQARGFVAVDGLENGIRGKCLTKQQIFRPRKSTENIMVEMVDKLRTWKEPEQGKPKRPRKSRRRRGPRVLVVNFS
ncbi:MAG: hypothetical protein JSW07_03365 [bacterium]|nr:MAG: hypothetical protein JSW07_03365 [bacterium]